MKFKKIISIFILTFLFTWMGGVSAFADSSFANSTTVLKSESANQAGQIASLNASWDAICSVLSQWPIIMKYFTVGIKPEPGKTVIPKLCISTYTQEKSGVWTYDTGNKKWDQIIKDRNVMLSSCLNKTEEKAYFIDALGDDDPWQVFCCDLKIHQVTQLTSNTLGKGFITPGADDTYYILQPNRNGCTGVFKLKESNGKYVESCAVDAGDDTDIERFAVDGDQIISACYSLSEYNRNYSNYNSKSENGRFSTNYRLVITDAKGNSKTLGTYPREDIYLMKVNKDKSKLLLASTDKDGNNQFEIIDLSNGKILKTIKEKDICKNSEITRIINLGIYASWGEDGNTIYFSAVYPGAKLIDVGGINVSCTGLYKMDLINQKISRLDNFNNVIITDVSANYN